MQEPELLEQLYLGMATYDGVGHMRLCSALRRANRIRKGSATSSSSSSTSHASLISDNTEVVQLLVRASEQYSQVGKRPCLRCITSDSAHLLFKSDNWSRCMFGSPSLSARMWGPTGVTGK